MNIDIGSLFYNSTLDSGGGQPSWGTALGQSSPDYRLTYPGSEEILIAMNFKYVPLSNSVSCKLGKGGKEYGAIETQAVGSKYEIVMAALFEKTFVRLQGQKIRINKPCGLLVVKENESVHAGRKSLKYSDSIKINNIKNVDFYNEVTRKLGGENVCWFAYSINVENQDELIFSVAKVDEDVQSYASSEERKSAWLPLLPETVRNALIYKGKNLSERVNHHNQVVYYGVPGCGKSKTVKDNLSSVDEFTRVVFHADFSNADFIGQILPETVNGNVQYKYKPSAFIKMLKDAYKNPEKKYALIIEELNRGNAPAIFGSLFQLLDRKASTQQTETINGNTYDVGWSDYSVSLENVNAYFRTEDGFDSPDESTVLGGITITAKEGIRFPKNLSIYATMNTSDQNVFTLDNAFQRRWSMQMVSNELKDESQKNLLIGNTGVTWEKFRNAMNARIIAASNFSSLEDRRLGGWFILKDSFVFVFENGSQESKDAISKQAFANKVIKYLWDDAFKFDRSIFVNSEGKTLEDVINDFNNDNIGMKIFDAEFNQAINA